jgi:Fe-S oxidoreductase/nitrate reductase gamma subunit
METSRQIYWNVGHSVVIPMYILVFLAIVLLVYNFKKRVEIYKKGKYVDRFSNWPDRLSFFIENTLGQIKVLNVPVGIFHAFLFWGFIVLFIGTALIFIQADILDPLFGITFLKGTFYKLFSISLDIAGFVAIVMLGGFFVRRFFIRPEGLETTTDDYVMHALLFSILITGFIVEGLRMAATELTQNFELARWSPVGLIVARLFAGMDQAFIMTLHVWLWWIHLLLVIAFFVSVPFVKFRHIVTTSINYYFTDMRRKGSIDTIDIENEELETFGVSSIKDFTWKDIFDTDACTKCKRCQDRCPAYNTGKPLSPMKFIADIGETAFNAGETALVEKISKDTIWSCTTCRACQEICPANIEHVNKIIEIRRNLVLMEGEFPGEEVKTAMDNMEVNGNPMGMGFASRGDFARDMGIKMLSEDANVDIMYFVGCYASFDKRNQKIARHFIELCNLAGIKAGMLGKEEKCCGEPARKLGNEYLYQSLAKENILNIRKYNIKKIVTACPHCFNTLNRDYRDLGLDVEVEHYTTFLYKLLNTGKIKIDNKTHIKCTYHDSCYLGRYMDIYDEPREILKALGELVEMRKSRADSFCCGAGGGRIIAEEKIGEKISVKRVRMAEETSTDAIVTNCPFCMTMLEDGLKMAGLDDRMQIKDLSEILFENVRK